jgi:hypothetical protein
MNENVFSNLKLVGGTSLALQIGHRQSIDIDMFGNIEADEFEIAETLNKLGQVTILKKTKNINIYLIDNIKVDLVNYHYQWIDETIVENEIRLAGKKDIAAMKLAAITGRGSKKDFIDLYFLLKQFTLDEIFMFYKLKYNDASEMLVLKSLSYFEDANNDEEPNMLEKVSWENVKKKIITTLNGYLKERND